MEADDIVEVYAVVCATYEREFSALAVKGWQLALAPFESTIVEHAVAEILREKRPFPPKPGEIVDMIHRLDGTIPPTLDAATGYYLAGQLDAHPLVREAAAAVPWDVNHPDVADRARFQFRNAYAALIDRHEDDRLRPAREAIEAGSPAAAFAALIAGEATT